jgi:ankyrin repeat protein
VNESFDELKDIFADAHNLDNGTVPPLHEAARQGDVDAVLKLLDAGEAVDARDNENRTPLMHAAREGKHDVVRRAVLSILACQL